MEERKAKSGWTALLIVSLVFMIIGAVYIIIGAIVGNLDINEQTVIFGYTFGGLGAVLLVVGVICLSLEIRKRKRNNRLIHSGKYIFAEISEITMNYAVRVNFRHPYIVICRYQDMNGYVHTFRSRNLNFDPEPFLRDRMVRIYVEEDNFKHYYMDIDSILPAVTEH